MDLAATFAFLRTQPLLLLALCAIFVHVAGGVIRTMIPSLGRLLQGVANLGLVAALLLTIAQVARLTTGADFAVPQLGLASQTVTGRETRVEMSGDGHFWLSARVNGTPARFMIDTGATVTALSPDLAERAHVERQALRQEVAMNTANGTILAKLGTVRELRFGNVAARDLDVVVAPGLGETNVIGMNLLSRLASWRVEGRTMILVPRHPQPASD